MRTTITRPLLLPLLLCLMVSSRAQDSPVDVVNSRQYVGSYVATQSGQTFDYLDNKEGRIVAYFYGSPNQNMVNSVSLQVLDPRYRDSKMVIIEIKEILNVGSDTQWNNSSHQVTLITTWKQRIQQEYLLQNVSTSITFHDLDLQDYSAVGIQLIMKGLNFQLTAHLTYFNKVVSTLTYSLYVGALVAIQIYSAFKMNKMMEAPNFVFTARLSLLTLSICTIVDFSQAMSHIQYILGNTSGYLLFLLPAVGYVVLFIIFDMKMLFMVWRSNNLINLQNPQVLRKKLTSFYLQFYVGLFAYLGLDFFFSNEVWMIIVGNLLLVPQIIHNIRLGQLPGFNLHYILGYVATRTLLPFYQRLCPANRFALTPNLTIALLLPALVALQVLVLFLQSRLGARFFVPKRFQPNYYNYKLKISRDDQEEQLVCSICLSDLFEQAPGQDHSINGAAESARAAVAAGVMSEASLISLQQPLQKEVTIMNTPCNHKFHEQCLMDWMEVKLECPDCRALLPPA